MYDMRLSDEWIWYEWMTYMTVQCEDRRCGCGVTADPVASGDIEFRRDAFVCSAWTVQTTTTCRIWIRCVVDGSGDVWTVLSRSSFWCAELRENGGIDAREDTRHKHEKCSTRTQFHSSLILLYSYSLIISYSFLSLLLLPSSSPPPPLLSLSLSSPLSLSSLRCLLLHLPLQSHHGITHSRQSPPSLLIRPLL